MSRLRWQSPVAVEGRGLADWLRDLRGGLNGVYLIRDARTREMLYVGESHTGRLYETLTRHLYSWNGPNASAYTSTRRRGAFLRICCCRGRISAATIAPWQIRHSRLNMPFIFWAI